MREEAVTTLAKAVYGAVTAETLVRAGEYLDKIESEGMTLYKKKVFVNGRRPNASTPMTPLLREQIRATFRNDPTLTQQEIANIYNVNSGRVAEALRDDA